MNHQKHLLSVAASIVLSACTLWSCGTAKDEHVGEALEDENAQYCASACELAVRQYCTDIEPLCNGCARSDEDTLVVDLGVYRLNCYPACDAACLKGDYGLKKCFRECLVYGRSPVNAGADDSGD